MSAPAPSYSSELKRSMQMLARDKRTIFIGQGVRYKSTRQYDSLDGIMMERRIEMPVAEDFQMGFSTGLSLEGFIPVSIFPRWDFLLLAANQIVNHLDKISQFGWQPKVIVRVAVGSTSPLNPGPQHSQDHSVAFDKMVTIPIVRLLSSKDIYRAYSEALASRKPTILVEYMSLYD